MGVSKTQIFSKDQNHLAKIFRVLSHPARIAILQYLSKQQGCICNDIVEEIGLAQPTISQHLKELKHMGLIEGEIEGKKICYCINKKMLLQFQQLTQSFFTNTQANCC